MAKKKKHIRRVEPESPKRGGSSWSFALIIVGLLCFTVYMDTKHGFSPAQAQAKQYQVISVKHGSLQVLDMQTGKKTEIRSQQLVKAALGGKIKKGDKIKF